MKPITLARRLSRIVLTACLAQSAHAAGTWDAGTGGGNINWSSFNNWDDNLTPAAKDIIFTNTGGAAGTTVTSIVDTSYTIDSLNFRQDNTVNQTLSISSGQILSVTGSFTPTAGEATAALFGQPSDAGTTASTTNITGLGTFTVNSSANHFLVGYANATGSPTATVNMSGLSNFNATVDIFGVGRKGTINTNASRQQAGILTLARNNTITANEISVGSTTHISGQTGTHNQGGASTLNLGSGGSAVNNLYADKMSFGIGKAVGNMNFAAGVVATDTVKIRAKDTVGAVGTFEVGVRNMSSTSGTPSGTVNFGAGKVDALITNLNVGQWANGAGTSGVNPTGTFTTGTNALSTITVTTLNLANSGSTTGVTALTVTGNLNVTGGLFSATTVNLATGTATTGLTKTANLTVDGGTFRFGTFGTPTGTNDVNIAFKSGAVASIDGTGRTLGLAYDLGKTGGSTVTFGQASGGTGTIALNGAGTLVDATIMETLVNTTIGAGNLGGAFALTKTGASTLTLTGTLGASAVNINVGTISLGANDRLSNTATVTVAGGNLDTGTALTDTVGTFNMSSGSITGTGTITAATYGLSGGTVTANLGTGTITANSGTTALNGTAAATTINVGGGTLTLGSAGRLATGAAVALSSGGLTLAGTESVASYQQTGGTLAGTGFTLTSAAAYDMQAGIVSANLGGSGIALNKTGTGSLTLSGTNTYTGATTVSAGTLLVTGALGATDVTVNGGAFGGTGTVGGALDMVGGSLHVANLLDPLDVTGTVGIYSGFGIDDLTGLDWGSIANGTYTLINGTLGSGVFAALANNSLATAYDLGGGRSAYFEQGSLDLVVIPEPRAAFLGGLGLLALLRRRR